MSAPYRIVNKYHETLVQLHANASLVAAMAVCRQYREQGLDKDAQIHGDNVDLDCADGLSREERETIEENGL